MKQVILNTPKQFKVGVERAKHIKLKGDFDKIMICGMGGSALPGPLLMDYLHDLKLPVYIHRSYGLPPQANEKSIIIAISYSGNTEETLSAYEEAAKKGLKVAAISTGAKLQELAEKYNLPIALIPKDSIQPRFSVPYQFSALLKILFNAGIIEERSKEVLEMAESLEPGRFEEQGKELAKKLVDKVPVVYSSAGFKAVARIWKIKLNENSKIMAFWNYFPELNHNEMVGLTNMKAKFHFIIFKEADDHPRIKIRKGLFADLAKEKGAEVCFIEMEGKNRLEKIFNTLLIGDWVSYYLALEYNQDPIPVKIVEEFKKRLKE